MKVFVTVFSVLVDVGMAHNNCKDCSPTRKTEWNADPSQLKDCILWANEQSEDFYQHEFLEYKYDPCHDPEEIMHSAGFDAKNCIPLNTPTQNEPLLKDQKCTAGTYKHYHWTIQDYDVINHNAGSSIEFSLIPCHGKPEIFIKPQILYAGIPMCQLFETNSTHQSAQGQKTSTWPFPDRHTGSGEQGPDWELFMLEKKAKAEAQQLKCGQGTADEMCSQIQLPYPGQFFSNQKWGHNGTQVSEDGRPQPQRITIPSISYGGFFVSVYCHVDSEFEIGIKAKKKIDADADRHAYRDDDRLAMKVRRWMYDVDDVKIDNDFATFISWAQTNYSKSACEDCATRVTQLARGYLPSLYCQLLQNADQACVKEAASSTISNGNCDDDIFLTDGRKMEACMAAISQIVYQQIFGLKKFEDGYESGAHHPEASPQKHSSAVPIDSSETSAEEEIVEDPCHKFKDATTCVQACCAWSPVNDGDFADFVRYGPFGVITRSVQENGGICRPATTKQSLCVTKKYQSHMQIDNQACQDDNHRDEGDCEREIQSTMEVSFYTGETGEMDDPTTWPLFQLQYVEMNDCVSQMDKIGQSYCWEAKHDRFITEFGEQILKPAGPGGKSYAKNCGYGSGTKENPKCESDHQSRGKCFWDGTPPCENGNTEKCNPDAETQWSKNAETCIMWTACGVSKNGMPVMIEHKKGKSSTALSADQQPLDLVMREIPAETSTQQKFDVKDSLYLYGHVTDITLKAPQSDDVIREVLRNNDTWFKYKPRRWIRVEVPVYNNVTYFFNVIRKLPSSDEVEVYNGVSAVTTFYHQTQLYSDTTILIIAAVVVAALFALLIPFIFTKRKIKAHLREVYEKHKERGTARAKEPRTDAEKNSEKSSTETVEPIKVIDPATKKSDDVGSI